MMSKDALDGMKAICQYVEWSEVTVLKMIRLHDFPAKKIIGIWMSCKSSIDQWRKDQINSK